MRQRPLLPVCFSPSFLTASRKPWTTAVAAQGTGRSKGWGEPRQGRARAKRD